MKYNFKQQLPYIIGLSVMTLVYQYGINGYFAWWQAILCTLLTPLALIVWKYCLRPDNEFSIAAVLKKYGHVCVIAAIGNGYMFYMKHHCICITNIALTLLCMVMTFVIMERSIYD